MKTSCKYLSILCFAAILGACTDERVGIAGEEEGQLPITLAAAYPTASRASDSGFEDGDRMGVYVMDYVDGTPQAIDGEDTHAGNVLFSFDGKNNSWNGVRQLYWTSKTTPADIIGYYPYIRDIGNGHAIPFTVSRRQNISGSENALGEYEASDFLWAKAVKTMPTDSRVNLTFRHLMAGVRVTLVEGTGFNQGEWSGLEKTVLVSNVITNAVIDIETGDVKTDNGEPVPVVPYQTGSDWRAVVVPQRVEAGKSILDMNVGNKSYQLVKGEPMTYTGGKLHSFTVTVNKLSDNGDLEFKMTGEAITAWIDDVDFRDGIVRNYLIVDVAERGGLEKAIESAGIGKTNVTGLKLTGEINEKDFEYMRNELDALKSLNLYDVKVWEGERENVIPERAMYEKRTLRHIVFPKDLKIIGSDAFFRTGLMGSLIIPEGVEKIGERPYIQDTAGWISIINRGIGTFAYCENLVGELSLPSTLTYIEDCAFAQAKFTGPLNIPESVKTIGNYAFEVNNFTGDLVTPEGVEVIGAGAFARNAFTGKLVLPSTVDVINASAFHESGFTGVLSLPEGVREIEIEAFKGCGFRGELQLPSTLVRISNKVFAGTKISSVVFPENLAYIGDGAFMNCKYLRGSAKLPKKILRVNEFLFTGCSQLGEVELPENVVSVGGAAFYGCVSLKRVVCNNPEPPLMNLLHSDPYGAIDQKDLPAGAFDGIPRNNFTLEVPEGSVELYRRADGWREFGRISQQFDFVCQPATACALNSRHSETLTLSCEGEWEVIEKPDWCSLSRESGFKKSQIVLTISEMANGSGNRDGKIVFKMKDSEAVTECSVSQFDYRYAADECVTLQRASKGRGIDILFVGDGWDAASIAGGEYLDLVNRQMEAFFGIEPYMTYRDRFNVYACVTMSQETGINTISTWRNTKFSTFYAHDCNGNGSLQLDNADDVFDYAVAHSPLTAERMPQSLIIMSLNNDEYGSATFLTENGSGISICASSEDSYPMDTRGIVQHEACGHAFGKLAEERIQKNAYISDPEKWEIQNFHWRGWYQNISATGKMSDVPWNHLIFDPRYSDAVDVYEGGYGKTRGAFRCELNSCMNYGIPYFNAISRQDIMKRILEYSGEGFSMEKFYATDSDKWGPTSSGRSAMVGENEGYAASGRHYPVRIVKSKKY